MRASRRSSGQFRFKAKARFNAVDDCKDGKRAHSESNEPAHYLLRAPGCEDYVLEVSPGWQPREIVLSRLR